MKQSELKHKLLDQSKDLIWIIDLDYKLIYANKKYLNTIKILTGKEHQLQESAFLESFGEDYIKKWKGYYSQALNGESFEVEEHHFNPATNEINYGQTTFEPLTDEAGRVFAVSCQSKDITRLVNQKSEKNHLMDSSLDVFCTINEDGKFVYVSAAAVNHWGYLPQELVGMAYQDLIFEDDVSKTTEIAAAIFNGQEITAFVNRYKKKDGGIAYNLWSVRWDDTAKLMYCVARDCKETIEKETIEKQEIIQQSELRFKTLVQEGSDLIRILDQKGNFLYVSPTSKSILGFEPEYFIGKHPLDFIHPDDREKASECLKKIKTEKKVIVDAVRFLNSKGEWQWMESILTNMLDNPAINGIVANSRDVTEEKRLKELNRKTNKLAKIGSWEVDLVNNRIFWSDEVHQLHETNPSSFAPDLVSGINFYRKDFKEIVQKSIKNCINTGEPFDFEAVLVTAKKRELWVRSIGNAEFVDGVCKRIYGSFQDIDDLKEAESKLLSLSENLPGLVYQYKINPDGTDALTYVAGAVEQIWGFTANEVLGNVNLVWDQIKAGGDYNEVQANVLSAIQTKTRWSSRFKYVMPSGELKFNLGNGTPIFLADGTILFNSIVLDITEEAKNEELLNQVSEMASIGSWEMDLINPESDNMYWSPMAKQIIGVGQDYHSTLNSGLEFCHGESKEILNNAVRHLIKDGVKFDVELKFITALGEKRWARVIGKSETIKNRCTKIYGSFQDITVSKKTELELIKAKEKAEESEIKFKAYTEQSPVAMYTTDVNGDCVYANQTYLDLLGLSLNDILGKGWMNALHPDDLQRVGDGWYKSVKANGKWHYEYRFINKMGETIWVDGTAKELFNEKNEFIGYLGINVNITERKKAKASLIKANERFEKVTEATNDAIWDWDLENNTIYRSKVFEKFFGIDPSNLSKLHEFWQENFHPDEIEKNKKFIEEAIANPSVTNWELEYLIFDKDKNVGYVVDRGLIIRNCDGKATRMVGAMSDLTKQKEAQLQEEKLVKDILHRNKNLEQFSYIISHNLRAPVANILGLISLLDEKDAPKETIDFINSSICASANKLDDVIKNLNEILQVKNNISEKKELVNFANLTADINYSIDKQIKSDNATINWDFKQAPEMLTIKSYIHSIFYNLISNSLKYRQKHVPLLIEIKSELIDNKIILLFKDNGMGIDLIKQKNTLFGLYKRFHTDYAEGKGVGLFMVKTQVETIGGAITVNSEVNKGTEFIIEFPLS
jgi:PAS domain S-box-containing protein